jgi:hypothetical protein
MLVIILLIVALVFFVLAAFSWPPNTGRFNLIAAGLALVTIAWLVERGLPALL